MGLRRNLVPVLSYGQGQFNECNYDCKNWVLLGHYTASSGNALSNFRNNPSVPFSRKPIGRPKTSVRNYQSSLPYTPEELTYIKIGPTNCPKTSVRNYQSSLSYTPEELTCIKIGPTNCPETSVRNYHSSLRRNSKERISHLLLGGSLKSCKLRL